MSLDVRAAITLCLVMTGCAANFPVTGEDAGSSACTGAAAGTACGGGMVCDSSETCVESRCGDAIVDARTERCDDGNDIAFDGCTECEFSCDSDSDCDDGDPCDGEGHCDIETHVCELSQSLPQGTTCETPELSGGVCGMADAQPACVECLDEAQCGGAPCVESRCVVDAPVVDGEESAGHRRPTWTWTTPAGATGFRHRLDGGAWVEVGLTVTSSTPTVDLADGPHTIEVEAVGPRRNSAPGSFTTVVERFEQPGFWNGVERALATTPHGHIAAISAHNCYSDGLATPAANLGATLDRLHTAQAVGADLLELDVKEQAGVIRVDHNDDGGTEGALLAEALADPALQAGDQILFIELKESAPTDRFVRGVLDLLLEHREHYARNGRPVVLRSFNATALSLSLAQTALADPRYALIRQYVRLSELYGRDQAGVAASQALIEAAAGRGYDMIELHYQESNLFAKLLRARALGLGVNLWTVPVTVGEVFVANARQEVDAITVDYPVMQARRYVEDANALFHLNAWEFAEDATSLAYLRTGTETFTAAAGGVGQPTVEAGARGTTLYGGHLGFLSANTQALALYDSDTLAAGDGVLVSAVVRFNILEIADGATAAILNKSQSGGWALELFNPAGAATTVLRFGVFVGSAYVYATYPASSLNTTDSYFLTGAYDGDGSVRLWIDNDASGTTVGAAILGGMINNDVPAVIGADPEAGGASRFYFDGQVQMVMAQSWGAH